MHMRMIGDFMAARGDIAHQLRRGFSDAADGKKRRTAIETLAQIQNPPRHQNVPAFALVSFSRIFEVDGETDHCLIACISSCRVIISPKRAGISGSSMMPKSERWKLP